MVDEIDEMDVLDIVDGLFWFYVVDFVWFWDKIRLGEIDELKEFGKLVCVLCDVVYLVLEERGKVDKFCKDVVG